MNIDWTTVLVALLGSNLVIEIWKTIKEAIAKHNRLDVESELTKVNNKIANLELVIEDINKKLDNDLRRFETIEKCLEVITEVMSRNSRGTILSLENDQVIFNALRNNHINGESETQEKKLDEYYKECAEFNLKMHMA